MERKGRDVGGLLLRDGDGRGGKWKNYGRERREEGEGREKKAREKPALPIKIVLVPPGIVT